MGVTIHYRGRLDDIKKLPVLCDEMIDIAKVMGWKYARLDDDWSITVDAKLDGNEITGNLGLKKAFMFCRILNQNHYIYFLIVREISILP